MTFGLGLKLGLGRGGGVRRFVTDIFNLLQNSPTYTGGALTVTDHEGTLVTSPTNTAGFEGGRLIDGVWYDTDTEGAALQTSVNIPTKAGTRKWYTEPFSGGFGYSNWPARTNKVTCRKFNPVDTTNFTLSGDAAAVLSVADSAPALAAVKLSNICTSGKVYRLDNSAGVGEAFLRPGGDSGNNNPHSGQAYARLVSGVGPIRLGWDFTGSAEFGSTSSSIFTLLSGINKVPPITNAKLLLSVPAGCIAEVILPDLQEGTFITPPFFDPDEDTLATVTRAATNLDEPLESLGTQLQLVVVPAATSTAGTLLDDGTNKLSYDGANLIFTDGVTTLSAAATLTAGETYTIGVKGLANDWALSLDTIDIDTDATGSVVAWTPASVRLGRDAADSDHFAGWFPNIGGYEGTDATWYKTTLG
jgi:hypothetical protein